MKFKVGDRVKTDYGDGVIEDTNEKTDKYQVYLGDSIRYIFEGKDLKPRK